MYQDDQFSQNISGFGKFGTIKENPTGVIVSKFTQEFKKEYNIVYSQVLEVLAYACQQYVNNLPDNTLNIHFGVDQQSKEFNIEQYGRNIMEFTIPDERGYQPRNEQINAYKKYIMLNKLKLIHNYYQMRYLKKIIKLKYLKMERCSFVIIYIIALQQKVKCFQIQHVCLFIFQNLIRFQSSNM